MYFRFCSVFHPDYSKYADTVITDTNHSIIAIMHPTLSLSVDRSSSETSAPHTWSFYNWTWLVQLPHPNLPSPCVLNARLLSGQTNTFHILNSIPPHLPHTSFLSVSTQWTLIFVHCLTESAPSLCSVVQTTSIYPSLSPSRLIPIQIILSAAIHLVQSHSHVICSLPSSTLLI